MSLYPLKFRPRLVEKIWGGRKLETLLGKALPAGKAVGESWEIYDFPPGVVEKTRAWVSSVVANGPLAGRTLHDLLAEHGRAIHGDVPLLNGQQFPILIKFLDAREDLSLQVHPTQTYADAHPGTHLKTEAWYVMENDPGAKIYRGLRPGTSAEAFRAVAPTRAVLDHVNALPVKPGQCFFLPSGTVHALGAGILVAEVQTPSDTTFRIYDFDRPEGGKPRTMHVDEAMACIDFDAPPDEPEQRRTHAAGFFTTVTRLATSDYFKVEKVRFVEGVEEPIPYDQPVVWMMLEGTAEVKADGVREPVTITRGETALLPAGMKNPTVRTESKCEWLEVTFPVRGSVE